MTRSKRKQSKQSDDERSSKPCRRIDTDTLVAILDEVGSELQRQHVDKLRDGINKAVECRNYLHAARKELPHQRIRRLQCLQKAAADLFAAIDGLDPSEIEIPCAAEWIEKKRQSGQFKQLLIEEAQYAFGRGQPGGDFSAICNEYLRARSRMSGLPDELLLMALDQDRVARIHLSAKLAEAVSLQEQVVRKGRPKVPALIRYEFMRALAALYQGAVGRRPAPSEESDWLTFLASVLTHVEGKEITPGGARSLCHRAGYFTVGGKFVSLSKRNPKRHF